MANSRPSSGLGLLRYFKLCRKDSCQISLPDPTGPLSAKVDSAAIQEANKEVTTVIASPVLYRSQWNVMCKEFPFRFVEDPLNIVVLLKLCSK